MNETALRTGVTPLNAASDLRDRKPSAEEILAQAHGLLTRSHLAELGLGRRAVDAVFREIDVIVLPGTRKPMISAAAYLALINECTYDRDRIRA
jgi:hypothetical protein